MIFKERIKKNIFEIICKKSNNNTWRNIFGIILPTKSSTIGKGIKYCTLKYQKDRIDWNVALSKSIAQKIKILKKERSLFDLNV